MTSIPSLPSKPAGDIAQYIAPKATPLPRAIPWGAYGVVYFIQATIMAMILMNIPVFLRQGLALDWLALIASYLVIYVPVLLRPAFAWFADRRPTSLASLLLGGVPWEALWPVLG